MTLSADGWLTYESFGRILGLVVAFVIYRTNRRDQKVPRTLPWAFAIWGVAGLLNAWAGLTSDGTEIAIVALSTLLSLIGLVGLAMGVRELRRSRAS